MLTIDPDLLLDLRQLADAGRFADAARLRRRVADESGRWFVHVPGLGLVEHQTDALLAGVSTLAEVLDEHEDILAGRVAASEWGAPGTPCRCAIRFTHQKSEGPPAAEPGSPQWFDADAVDVGSGCSSQPVEEVTTRAKSTR